MVNEKRLIDANARIKWMEDNTANSEWMVSQYSADWICSMLETAPTVNALEVVNGRCEKSVAKDEWYGYIYTCKECEYQCMVDDGTGNEVPPNYCPNCGAKVNGGSNNE